MAELAPVGAPSPAFAQNPSKKAYNFCDIQPICSLNCPQFCYNFFLSPPPPNPLFQTSNSNPTTSSSPSPIHIFPILAAIIAALSAAFLIIFYFAVIAPILRHHRRRRRQISHEPDDPSQPGRSGLDEAFIREITVFKYRKDEGLIEGTDCAVCLNEFNEEEDLRLMPNCEHAFHIPCIDEWLKTQSSCPLCRAGMYPTPPPPQRGVGDGGGGGGRVADVVVEVRSSGEEAGVAPELEEIVVCHGEVVDGIENGEEVQEIKGRSSPRSNSARHFSNRT